MNRLAFKSIVIAALALSLSGCALFQQVPGRVTTTDFTTEAGAVYGKTVPVPGGCPGIVFGGAQNVGEVTATCTGSGAAQSITAKSIDANSVLQTAIAGQTALGQQLANVAQAALAALAAGGKTAATGGALGTPGPTGPAGDPGVRLPMLVCPVGTVITMQAGQAVCL